MCHTWRISLEAIFYVLHNHQWNTKPFHLNIFFAVKSAIYHLAIAVMTF